MEKQVLESETRLSNSLLWKLQADYFESRGMDAWKVIPTHATSNVFATRMLAELVIAFLNDARARLDQREPLYVLEIGGGTGQGAFNLLRALREMQKGFAALANLDIRYILTDVPEKNIAAWQRDEGFRKLVSSGRIDFAVFDPTREQQLTLRESGVRLEAGSIKNPLVAIASYVFDALPHDLFRIANGKLLEGKVTLERTRGDRKKPPAINEIEVTETYDSMTGPAYADPELNAILEQYRVELDKATIILPVGAMQCVRNLKALAGGDLLLLASDKGFSRTINLASFTPFFATHGSLSYSVNFDALRRYVVGQGGTALCTEDDSLLLQTAMLILGTKEGAPFESSRHVFRERLLIDANVPNDLLNLHYLLPGERGAQTPADRVLGYLAFLRACRCDPAALELCVGPMSEAFEELPEDSWEFDIYGETARALTDRALEQVYLLDPERRLDLHAIGNAYYALNAFEKSASVFRLSLERFGPDAFAHYYVGASEEMLDNPRSALAHFAKAAALEPDDHGAQDGIARIRALLSLSEESDVAAPAAAARFDLPEIDVKYEGFELVRPPTKVTDEMVDKQIARLRWQRAQLTPADPTRAVRRGDVVTIYIKLSIDGTEATDGEGERQVELGAGRLHPALEAGILHKAVGANFVVETVFGGEQVRAELRGKKASFQVSLREVKEKVLPPIDDDFAKGVGAFQTLEDLRADVRTRLEKGLRARAETAVAEQIAYKLNEANPIAVPPTLIEDECRRMRAELVFQARRTGQKVDEKQLGPVSPGMRVDAEKRIRAGILMGAIARQNKLTATEDDIEKAERELAQERGKTVDEVRAEFRDHDKRNGLQVMILGDKILDLIESKSKIVEGPREAPQFTLLPQLGRVPMSMPR